MASYGDSKPSLRGGGTIPSLKDELTTAKTQQHISHPPPAALVSQEWHGSQRQVAELRVMRRTRSIFS